jgi:hypothetical protein
VEKKRKTKEEKKGGARKVKNNPRRPKPIRDKYWYDPDCGPVYPD